MTEDRKYGLGRRIDFDPSSRQFNIRRTTYLVKPRSYTWSCSKTLDQGTDGSCVGHAWAHELIARPCEVLTVNHEVAIDLYRTAQKLDPWEGGTYPGAMVVYEGTSVLAGAKATMLTGLISGYMWAFSLGDLIDGVGHHGPAVIGVNWYESMFQPDSQGLITVSGDITGGHAVLVRAVDIESQRFTIRNSWGASWGVDGDCYISFSDMDKLLKDQGEACFAIGRRVFPGFTPITEE